ncbi:hypothetical protein V054_02591 [Staphylococcus aureus MSSA-47]|uniref:hypothetical protein n=1 Tax=Staphylococcus aureus TaxID=1280 RepID=UPI00044E57D4|nr:hypothetical protein [Staphylococcus aureus]EZT42322.1 hypothetical protein V054_02591 [Staphylococcus aureus MSSA-47]EZY39795.1 hypothetical protein V055_01769 [Staphylococcus aureus MRSA-118]EZY44956.1 hypothetical protein V057_01162 [Staphylococcus aureus MRSA-136]HDE8650631.1 hypothetical protein [Staphylococcus aureus]HDE8874427.1 hypothetical protein [Staphylococcus aureus]
MTEFTPSFSIYKEFDYREFVILRYHNISKRKICKMYNIAYFRILEVCDMMRKNDFRFTYKDYQYLKSYNVSDAFICKMYHIDRLDLEFFEVMNR